MKPTHEFAILLAERVAPDEVDLAPAIADAAAEGGAAWERVRQAQGTPVFGGFIDGIDLATLTAVYGAFRAGVDLFAKVCESGANVAAIVDFCRKLSRDNAAEASTPGEKLAADELGRVAELLRREGLAPEQANVAAARVVSALAERPDLGRTALAAVRPGA